MAKIRKLAVWTVGALVLGAALGHFGPPLRDLVSAGGKKPEAPLRWRVAGAFPGDLVPLGSLGRRLAERVTSASDGTLHLVYEEPGELVVPEACFDAVAAGRVDACWSMPAHWYGKEPALALFSGVPFGLDVEGYATWMFAAGGAALMDGIYAKHGIKALICGAVVAEGGGWFRREVRSLDDLKGLRMRIFGLAARVVEKLGVSARRLKGSEIVDALRRGEIDASEYSLPAVDLDLGLAGVAKHYYSPGWHQRASALELLMNRRAWEALAPAERARVEIACGDNFRAGLAQSHAQDATVVARLEAEGVVVHRWPAEILSALEAAWRKVAAEESSANDTFKKVWASYSAFRKKYRAARRLRSGD